MRHTLRSKDGGSKSHKGCPQPTPGKYEISVPDLSVDEQEIPSGEVTVLTNGAGQQRVLVGEKALKRKGKIV